MFCEKGIEDCELFSKFPIYLPVTEGTNHWLSCPLTLHVQRTGKTELLNNPKGTAWFTGAVTVWVNDSASAGQICTLWMPALVSEQSHQRGHREWTPTQPIQTKGSIFFPVTCASAGALRKAHSSLVYFWSQNPFSWAGSEMRCQKHYSKRKHIHNLCCNVCTLLDNFPSIIIGEEPPST